MSVAVVLDAGALIALDRNDRSVWAMLAVAATEGPMIVRVPTGALAQAWRDGARQALLARALRACEEVPLDGHVARAAGAVCGQGGVEDVIDASVVLAAADTATSIDTAVVTTDPDDIAVLADALPVAVTVVRV